MAASPTLAARVAAFSARGAERGVNAFLAPLFGGRGDSISDDALAARVFVVVDTSPPPAAAEVSSGSGYWASVPLLQLGGGGNTATTAASSPLLPAGQATLNALMAQAAARKQRREGGRYWAPSSTTTPTPTPNHPLQPALGGRSAPTIYNLMYRPILLLTHLFIGHWVCRSNCLEIEAQLPTVVVGLCIIFAQMKGSRLSK